VFGVMPNNSGKKLGNSLKADKKPAPQGETVSVYYAQGAMVQYPAGKNKKKKMRIYGETVDSVDYDLQYAPHHLIPGNESLKGSQVVQFLGAASVITHFKGDGADSCIKPKMSVGYDINSGLNGEWLPSPYALSMSNEWPAAEGIEALYKSDARAALIAENFKMAYASASINHAGKQFHMRHAEYSAKVREILDAMGSKMKLLAVKCPESKDENDDKFNPPGALKAKLETLSGKLRGLVTGSVTGWHNPLFVDSSNAKYYEETISAPQGLPNLKIL
jgi:hypothetical protein